MPGFLTTPARLVPASRAARPAPQSQVARPPGVGKRHEVGHAMARQGRLDRSATVPAGSTRWTMTCPGTRALLAAAPAGTGPPERGPVGTGHLARARAPIPHRAGAPALSPGLARARARSLRLVPAPARSLRLVPAPARSLRLARAPALIPHRAGAPALSRYPARPLAVIRLLVGTALREAVPTRRSVRLTAPGRPVPTAPVPTGCSARPGPRALQAAPAPGKRWVLRAPALGHRRAASGHPASSRTRVPAGRVRGPRRAGLAPGPPRRRSRRLATPATPLPAPGRRGAATAAAPTTRIKRVREC
jgi:hypothetical protein